VKILCGVDSERGLPERIGRATLIALALLVSALWPSFELEAMMMTEES